MKFRKKRGRGRPSWREPGERSVALASKDSGVDGLAKSAGVTSGAFYAYFKSKAEAFRATVSTGMEELNTGIRAFREKYTETPTTWIERFAEFYMGEKRTCDLTEACALQALTSEVARADEETRDIFEAQLRAVIETAAEGIEAPSAKARRSKAIAMLALLSGGVSLARAVNDPAFSEEIAKAIRAALRGAHAPRDSVNASGRK